MLQLDFAGRVMRENQSLEMMVVPSRSKDEGDEVANARYESIAAYLDTRWQISRERIRLSDQQAAGLRTKISFQAKQE
jgi:hypothetical protein